MNKEFLICGEKRKRSTSNIDFKTSTAWKRIPSKRRDKRNNNNQKKRAKSTRSKRLWCFVSHRLWQHKNTTKQHISTIFFFFVVAKSVALTYVYIRKKRRNILTVKPCKEHAKIACQFRYYKCMFRIFRRSFLDFDNSLFFSFSLSFSRAIIFIRVNDLLFKVNFIFTMIRQDRHLYIPFLVLDFSIHLCIYDFSHIYKAPTIQKIKMKISLLEYKIMCKFTRILPSFWHDLNWNDNPLRGRQFTI